MLDPSQVSRFESQGFLLVPGLLDPKAELAALGAAYQDLIEALAAIYFAEAEVPLPTGFRERPLGERSRYAGASGEAASTSTRWLSPSATSTVAAPLYPSPDPLLFSERAERLSAVES